MQNTKVGIWDVNEKKIETDIIWLDFESDNVSFKLSEAVFENIKYNKKELDLMVDTYGEMIS